MKEHTPLGTNRTGVQMSPFDASEMQTQPASSVATSTPGDDSALAEMRALYVEEADPVGSVPVPGTIKGAMTTGFSALTGNQPQLLLDKLGERLAFERTGTRLYDAVIAKAEALGEAVGNISLDDLRQIRNEEARHFAIVVSAIESVGGDPTSQTPCADLVGVESMGLLQAVSDPRTTVTQALHSILVAEMTDNHGWESLIALAEDQGQDAMVTEFRLALEDERRHLMQVQAWYEQATLGRAISGDPDAMDQSPQQLH